MRSEEEQIESFKEWWSKNGKALLAGVVIAVAGVGGWKGWESHQINQAESASDLYNQLTQVVSDGRGAEREQQADALIERLTADFSSSVYADYARLFAARLAVERNALDAAQTHLQTALDTTRVNAIELIARLRLARILSSQSQVQEALALLEVPSAGGFTAEFESLRGDLLMTQGDASHARQAYQKALKASRAMGEPAPLVEIKMDQLATRGDA